MYAKYARAGETEELSCIDHELACILCPHLLEKTEAISSAAAAECGMGGREASPGGRAGPRRPSAASLDSIIETATIEAQTFYRSRVNFPRRATGAGAGVERRLNIRDDAAAVCVRHMNRDATHHEVLRVARDQRKVMHLAVAVMMASGNFIFGGTIRLSLHRAIASLVMSG